MSMSRELADRIWAQCMNDYHEGFTEASPSLEALVDELLTNERRDTLRGILATIKEDLPEEKTSGSRG